MDLPSVAEKTERVCISKGHSPVRDVMRRLVSGARQRFTSNTHSDDSVGRTRWPRHAAFPFHHQMLRAT